MQNKLKIVQIDGNNAVVSNQRGCSSCDTKGACGIDILSKYFNRNTVTLVNSDAKVGDEIEVSISNHDFFYDSFLLYLLPIFTLFIGAIIAPDSELQRMIYAFVGFIFGSFLVFLKGKI